MVEAADLNILIAGDLIQLADFEAIEKMGCEAAWSGNGRVKLVLPDAVEVRQLYQLAAEQNVQIRRLNHKRDSLEDIFLKAMEAPLGRL